MRDGPDSQMSGSQNARRGADSDCRHQDALAASILATTLGMDPPPENAAAGTLAATIFIAGRGQWVGRADF
jgi:hypothetical protein